MQTIYVLSMLIIGFQGQLEKKYIADYRSMQECIQQAHARFSNNHAVQYTCDKMTIVE